MASAYRVFGPDWSHYFRRCPQLEKSKLLFEHYPASQMLKETPYSDAQCAILLRAISHYHVFYWLSWTHLQLLSDLSSNSHRWTSTTVSGQHNESMQRLYANKLTCEYFLLRSKCKNEGNNHLQRNAQYLNLNVSLLQLVWSWQLLDVPYQIT